MRSMQCARIDLVLKRFFSNVYRADKGNVAREKRFKRAEKFGKCSFAHQRAEEGKVEQDVVEAVSAKSCFLDHKPKSDGKNYEADNNCDYVSLYKKTRRENYARNK